MLFTDLEDCWVENIWNHQIYNKIENSGSELTIKLLLKFIGCLLLPVTDFLIDCLVNQAKIIFILEELCSVENVVN